MNEKKKREAATVQSEIDIVKLGSQMLDRMKEPKRTKAELPALENALRKAEQEGDKWKIDFCLRAIEEAKSN